MKNESRTLKSLRNAQVSMFYYVLQLILGFWSRKVFLDYLGADILGLDSTAANLFSFLNLAELGVGAACTFFLYAPLNENNFEQINKIVALQGWIYRRVATIIIIGALILMCFFPWIFADITLPLWYAYATFSVMLLGSMLGYFINYKSIVLYTDQKGYKVTMATQGFSVFIKVLQILLLPIVASPFVFYLSTTFLFNVFGCLWLNYIIRKEYPWLKTDGYNGKELLKEFPDILKKTKQLFVHKVTTVIVLQSSSFLIYMFSSLGIVGFVGNYTTILSKINQVLGMVFTSMQAAVGSLIATGDNTRINRVFWELYDSRFCITGIAVICMFFLAHPFMALWLGEEYILGRFLLALLLIDTFIWLTRVTVDHYINGYGLFQDIWAPAAEGCINICGAIGLGFLFGFKGVLMGKILSQLIIVLMWKPYMLFTKGMKLPPKVYFVPVVMRYILLILTTIALSFLFSSVFPLPAAFQSYLEFAYYSIAVLLVVSVIVLGEFFMFSQGVKDFCMRIISLIKGKYS